MFAGNGDEIARSADAGAHWTTVELPHSARAIGVAFQPADDRTVYAWGFGGGHGGLTPGPPPGGVFKSDDSGSTWTKIASYEPDEVAAAASGMVYVAAETGLYETSDGGTTWREPRSGLPLPYGHSDNYNLAAIAPANSAIALVNGESGRQMNGGKYSGQFTTIVFRTTDSGDRWTASLRLVDASDIAFAPGSASVAYVIGDQANSAHTRRTRYHLFRTADAGRHWQPHLGVIAGRPIKRVLVDPSHASILYGETFAGQLGRSTDRGETWALLPPLPS